VVRNNKTEYAVPAVLVPFIISGCASPYCYFYPVTNGMESNSRAAPRTNSLKEQRRGIESWRCNFLRLLVKSTFLELETPRVM
jgi:hypothetical protein